MASLAALATLTGGVTEVLAGFYGRVHHIALIILSFFLVLAFNRKGWFGLATWFFIILACVLITIYAGLFGQNSSLEVLLFVFCGMSFVLLEGKSVYEKVASASIAPICFIWLRNFGYDFLKPYLIISTVQSFSTVITCIAFFVFIMIFAYLNSKAGLAVDRLEIQEKILRTLTEPVVVSSDQGKILYFNPAFDLLIRSIEGNALEQFQHLFVQANQESQATGKQYSGTFNYQSSGDEKIVTRARVMQIESGDTRYWLCVQQDYTERLRLQRDLSESQAISMANSHMAQIGIMAGGIAHEINTPLAIIQLSATLLRRELDANPSTASAVSIKQLVSIEKTVDRIAKIVRSLRTLSRDGSKDTLEDTRISDIVKDVDDLAGDRLQRKKINFSIEGHFDSLIIPCSRVQLSQILINLLNNSIDAIELLPNPWIKLEILQVEDQVKFVLTDCGQGIPPEVAEKIFTPFYTTKKIEKGTGLGLSLSIALVEAHQGTLVYNKESKNTQFVMTLPMKKAQSKAGSSAA